MRRERGYSNLLSSTLYIRVSTSATHGLTLLIPSKALLTSATRTFRANVRGMQRLENVIKILMGMAS